jgi:hypothetical protein
VIELTRGTHEEAECWIGHVAEPRQCAIEVSAVHGQLACCMVDDTNPLYWEPGRAGAVLGYDAVPASTLMTFGLPLPWSPDRASQRPLWAKVPLPGDTIINVATTTELPQPLPAGVRMTVTEQVTAVSELRRTRVGEGHFLTTRAEYHDADGTLRAAHENTMLRYDASHDESRPGDDGRHQFATPDTSPLFELVVDRRRLALNVAATWDFFPGHHDDAYARSQGVRGSYVNTLFLHALVDRAATELARRSVEAPALWSPTRRHMTMRRPVVVETRVAVWCEPVGDGTASPRRRFRVVATDVGGVCVDATIDVANVTEEQVA